MNMLDQFRLFSRYNQLMNQRIHSVAAKLSEEEISKNRGAFFGSLLGTLNHTLVGDTIWLRRFSTHPSSREALAPIHDWPQPASLDQILYPQLDSLTEAQTAIDEMIIAWTDALPEQALSDTLSYKNMKGISYRKNYASLISHLFFHQTHHRGQATTLLSQAGVDFGDTDMVEIISDEYS
ncbi:MAG: DinB family protein [Chromatiales bacterium]|nr:DinB family protein [Chromatiales bacterium]